MNKETLSSIIRAVGIGAGSSFVTRGVLTGDELETFVSAAWTAWAAYQRNANKGDK
jgi:hypothetical protein